MSDICYPTGTDWSCAYTPEQLVEMRGDPRRLASMERSEALSWYTLARLTGYQIGVCPITVRPCAAGCGGIGTWLEAPAGSGTSGGLPTVSIGAVAPHINVNGQWVNSCGCSSRTACGCSTLSEVILPGPVGGIESVYLDGELVPPAAYRVDNGNRLVSLDSAYVWPGCQDLAAGPQEAGAFSVTYYQGAAPNDLTKFAAGLLATEFYKACTGSKCGLPTGVTQVVREGVSYTIETGLFANGFTGIRQVDAVISVYNPNGLTQAPVVVSPESRRRSPRRTTWVSA